MRSRRQILLGVTALGDRAPQCDFPDGVLADFAVVPKQQVTPLPASISPRSYPLAELPAAMRAASDASSFECIVMTP